jgi:hypothetical protein
MRIFDREQRKLLSEKLLDLANLGGGALVFGQLVTSGRINWKILWLGVVLLAMIYSFSLYLRKIRLPTT